ELREDVEAPNDQRAMLVEAAPESTANEEEEPMPLVQNIQEEEPMPLVQNIQEEEPMPLVQNIQEEEPMPLVQNIQAPTKLVGVAKDVLGLAVWDDQEARMKLYEAAAKEERHTNPATAACDDRCKGVLQLPTAVPEEIVEVPLGGKSPIAIFDDLARMDLAEYLTPRVKFIQKELHHIAVHYWMKHSWKHIVRLLPGYGMEFCSGKNPTKPGFWVVKARDGDKKTKHLPETQVPAVWRYFRTEHLVELSALKLVIYILDSLYDSNKTLPGSNLRISHGDHVLGVLEIGGEPFREQPVEEFRQWLYRQVFRLLHLQRPFCPEIFLGLKRLSEQEQRVYPDVSMYLDSNRLPPVFTHDIKGVLMSFGFAVVQRLAEERRDDAWDSALKLFGSCSDLLILLVGILFNPDVLVWVLKQLQEKKKLRLQDLQGDAKSFSAQLMRVLRPPALRWSNGSGEEIFRAFKVNTPPLAGPSPVTLSPLLEKLSPKPDPSQVPELLYIHVEGDVARWHKEILLEDFEMIFAGRDGSEEKHRYRIVSGASPQPSQPFFVHDGDVYGDVDGLPTATLLWAVRVREAPGGEAPGGGGAGASQ
ncbi:unnamed protein product, partial [Symbiodinium sp. CCMP2592]